MGSPDYSITPEVVSDLADGLGFAPTESEAERLADALNEDLPGYATLDDIVDEGEPTEPEPADVVFDPGPDDDPLNAFVTACRFERHVEGRLSGVHVAVKDNIALAGVPMTSGSRVFEDVVPGRNAAVVERLLEAGATLVGKTNMDELAYGPTSETSQYGAVVNPHDEGHVAGGSSSGSAAAVAAGRCDAALGTDTGGSVRIPAAFCGVVGFKPTWGTVPRDGVVDLAWTLDHVGTLAPDVETAALVFDVVGGADARDPSSAAATRLPFGDVVGRVADPPSLSECTFAVPDELLDDHVSDDVRERVESVVDDLEAADASVRSASLPTVSESVHAWSAVVNVELATKLARRGVPVGRPGPFDLDLVDAAADALEREGDGFGDVVQANAVLGAYLLGAHDGRHYVRGRNVCARISREFAAALDDVDALVSPTMPVTAPEQGAWGGYFDDDGLDVPLAFNTRPADMAGVPAVSLPAGRVDGLPVGLQLMGPRFGDADLLRTAEAVERHLA